MGCWYVAVATPELIGPRGCRGLFRTRREGRGRGGAAQCRGVPRTGPTARWHLGPEWGAGITGPGQRAASSAVRQPSCTRVATKGLVYLFFFPPPRLVLPAGGGGVWQAGSWRVLSLFSNLPRRPPPAVTSAGVGPSHGHLPRGPAFGAGGRLSRGTPSAPQCVPGLPCGTKMSPPVPGEVQWGCTGGRHQRCRAAPSTSADGETETALLPVLPAVVLCLPLPAQDLAPGQTSAIRCL